MMKERQLDMQADNWAVSEWSSYLHLRQHCCGAAVAALLLPWLLALQEATSVVGLQLGTIVQ